MVASTTERSDPFVSEGDVSLLLVEVDQVRCGLSALDVVEVHPVVGTSPLPGAPHVVEGVVNFRGSLVAVVDLRAQLGLRTRRLLLSDHLVVARAGSRVVALRVDRAVDLVAVAADRIESAVALADTSLVSGVAKLDDGLVVIYDLEAVLSHEEAMSLDAALVEAQDERRT